MKSYREANFKASFSPSRKLGAGDDSVILFGDATDGFRWVSFSGDQTLDALTLSIRPVTVTEPTTADAAYNAFPSVPQSDDTYRFWCLPDMRLVVTNIANGVTKYENEFENTCQWNNAWETSMIGLDCERKLYS